MSKEPSRIEAADVLRALGLPAARCVVYGTGAVAGDVHAFLTGRGFEVPYFVDHRKAGPAGRQGVPVLAPDDPAITAADRAGTPIILGIFNAYVDIEALTRKLQAAGWARVIHFLELYHRFPQAFGDRFWLTDAAYYDGQAEAITAAGKLWADAKSQDLYRGTLAFRRSGAYADLPAPDLRRQYFPEDVPAWRTPLRLVDCGAYDGDTLRQVRDLGIPVEAVCAFEPDPANFGRLAAEADAARSWIPQEIALWPCGAWSAPTQLRFASGHGTGSYMSAEGETVIQCTSIDASCVNFRPTLIKMDIEGAELEALKGARKTIERVRPGLAICLYHKPADLWEIPLLIDSWGLGYTFYLRCHLYTGFEMVLYAVAPEGA